MNGTRVKDLELEDRSFLRSVVAANLARVVHGRVQVRNASDIGYVIPLLSTAVAMAPRVVREWYQR